MSFCTHRSERKPSGTHAITRLMDFRFNKMLAQSPASHGDERRGGGLLVLQPELPLYSVHLSQGSIAHYGSPGSSMREGVLFVLAASHLVRVGLGEIENPFSFLFPDGTS